jgi:hypothetical protein
MQGSQTRKRSSSRAPRSLNDLQWLANPYEQLKRSLSFSGKAISDEEFYKFFDEIGEVPGNRSPRSSRRTHKNTGKKSPKRVSAGKSPKGAAGKSPKGAAGKRRNA